ncbi:hypothetical protein B0H14DRAFT_2581149 [Mycena olivaceomarginata]|nr:hypothetical protein B0H14DRAFT_2581149 [Mycena olivaceomarginata]
MSAAISHCRPMPISRLLAPRILLPLTVLESLVDANEDQIGLDVQTSHYELEEAEKWLERSERTRREGREMCYCLRKKVVGFVVRVTAVSARREPKLAEARVFLPGRFWLPLNKALSDYLLELNLPSPVG